MTRAMVSASFVYSPSGGNVDTVFTVWLHRRLFATFFAIAALLRGIVNGR
jgi:hypothetical protein